MNRILLLPMLLATVLLGWAGGSFYSGTKSPPPPSTAPAEFPTQPHTRALEQLLREKSARSDTPLPARELTSHVPLLDNADFEDPAGIALWGPPEQGVDLGAGFGQGHALAVAVHDQPVRLERSLTLPPERVVKNMQFSFSAWVWSDQPGSAGLELWTNLLQQPATSALHSGSGQWEHLTVAVPYSVDWDTQARKVDTLRLALTVKQGQARFDRLHPLVMVDDRFVGFGLDGVYRFRERVNYRKGERFRIVVLGGSTLYGVGAPHNATFSYLLQAKLEALHPGHFEVVNFAMGSGKIRDQIVGLRHGFLRPRFEATSTVPDDLFDRSVHVWPQYDTLEDMQRHMDNAVPLETLQPDLILQGTMWNDLYADLYLPFYFGKPALRELGGIGTTEDLSGAYYTALYRFMDAPTFDNHQAVMHAAARSEEAARSWVAGLAQEGFWPPPNAVDQVAERRFQGLSREFLSRARALAPVWLVDLPSAGGERYQELHRKAAPFFRHGREPDPETRRSLLGSLESLHRIGKIQHKVWQAMAQENTLPFTALSEIYLREYEPLPIREYIQLGHFNGDGLHFSARGNQWLVDRFYRENRERLRQLVEIRENTTP